MNFEQDRQIRMNKRQRAEQGTEVAKFRTASAVLFRNCQPEEATFGQSIDDVFAEEHLFVITESLLFLSLHQKIETLPHDFGDRRRRRKIARVKFTRFPFTEQRRDRWCFPRKLTFGAAIRVVQSRKRSDFIS